MVYQTREEMLQTLGANLKAARLADNITQQVAAERSGISLKAVRNLEAGKNSSTLSLLCYCRTLRKVDWLMQIAPSGVDDSLFERRDPSSVRQRATAVSRGERHG